MLLLTLDPTSSPQLPHCLSVRVIYKLVKRTTIPEVKSKLDLHANIFGAIEEFDTLQYD